MDQLSEQQRKHAVQVAKRPEIQGDSYLETAMTNLGLTELPKGKVLDIGAGVYGEFQSRARERYPKTDLISVNPLFGSDRSREDLQWVKDEIGSDNSIQNSVAAIAQQLPFKDESFDLVISHAAIPAHLPQDDIQFKFSFSEAVRVAKKGANIIFAPMSIKHRDSTLKALQDLQVPNLHIEAVEIPVGEYSSDQGRESWFRITLTKT